MKHPKVSVLAVLILVACAASPNGGSSLGSPKNGAANGGSLGERELGTINFYGEPVQVEVPSSVRQGQPFVVTVVTYGGGCIGKGETKVEGKALRAEVRPYDYDISPTLPINGTCTTELRHYEHTATLRFVEVGTAEIVFYGRKENLSGVTQTSATRTVEVR